MYNRHIHIRHQSQTKAEIEKEQRQTKLSKRRKSKNLEMGQKYKQKVKEFLLQVIVKPVPIDSYQPPITKILRDHHKSYIDEVNSKKIQKELKKYQSVRPRKSKFIDNPESPRKSSKTNPIYFSSQSLNKLPQIHPKLRFKALEQLGNNLKTMKQKSSIQLEFSSMLSARLGTDAGYSTFSKMALRKAQMIKPSHL